VKKIKDMLWIPEGFSHGFLTLTDEAEIIYKVSSAEYSPEHDAGIRWDDKDINIHWPFKEYEIDNPILSSKDASLPYLADIRGAL